MQASGSLETSRSNFPFRNLTDVLQHTVAMTSLSIPTGCDQNETPECSGLRMLELYSVVRCFQLPLLWSMCSALRSMGSDESHAPRMQIVAAMAPCHREP